jgi:hypothetical protein
MLSVTIKSIMLNVILLSVFMLNVAAPCIEYLTKFNINLMSFKMSICTTSPYTIYISFK